MAAGSTSAGTAAPASAPPLLSLPLLTAEDVLGERLAAAVEGTPEGGVEAFLAANVAGSSTLRRAVLKALAVSLSAAGMGWRPRARLLRALMRKLTRDWNTAAYAAVVLAGFTGLQGWDVYRAKYLIDACRDKYGLHFLVFRSLTETQRAPVVAAFAAAAAACEAPISAPSVPPPGAAAGAGGRITPKAAVAGSPPPRPVVLAMDIDDTLYPYLFDVSFPSGRAYPGVRALQAALMAGVPHTSGAPHAGRLTFITARPGLARGLTRNALAGMGHRDFTVLTGSLAGLLGRQAIVEHKLRNFRALQDMWPEARLVWVGDTGQGDVEVGRRLLAAHAGGTGGLLATRPLVLMHDVVLHSSTQTPKTPLPARRALAAEGVFVFDSFTDAALLALQAGALTPAAALEVAAACARGVDMHPPAVGLHLATLRAWLALPPTAARPPLLPPLPVALAAPGAARSALATVAGAQFVAHTAQQPQTLLPAVVAAAQPPAAPDSPLPPEAPAPPAPPALHITRSVSEPVTAPPLHHLPPAAEAEAGTAPAATVLPPVPTPVAGAAAPGVRLAWGCGLYHTAGALQVAVGAGALPPLPRDALHGSSLAGVPGLLLGWRPYQDVAAFRRPHAEGTEQAVAGYPLGDRAGASAPEHRARAPILSGSAAGGAEGAFGASYVLAHTPPFSLLPPGAAGAALTPLYPPPAAAEVPPPPALPETAASSLHGRQGVATAEALTTARERAALRQSLRMLEVQGACARLLACLAIAAALDDNAG